jgi:uncharacterized protein (DUF362 family)/Pyruvate/2-oxoacid:ferredoxin oxidoreductase delta subunit
MAKVMIHPATYENVRVAIDRVFEIFPLVLKGKKVLIKPNVLRASQPKEAVTTYPAVVRAVVEKVERMGPTSIIVGDNPGVACYGANEETLRTAGLIEAAGGYYQNIGNDALEVTFNADFMPKVSISKAVLEADVVISLPKFKTHGLTVITGAIKNSFGFLPGAQKAKLHMAAGGVEGFHRMIVDIFRLRVPDLFIVDAVVGMEGNGPVSPDLRDIGLILASDNGVTMDAVIATMMGIDPGLLLFLRTAQEKGLGSYDLKTVQIIGELRKLPGFKLPPLGGEANLNNPDLQEQIRARTLLRPQANPDLCTGCGSCVEYCPASALSMVEEYPQVDSGACITCFCCQEMCPEKAMTLT